MTRDEGTFPSRAVSKLCEFLQQDIPFSLTRDGEPAGRIVLRIEWSKERMFGPLGGGQISQILASPTPLVVPKLPLGHSSFSRYYNASFILPTPKDNNNQCGNIALPIISVATLSQDIETQCGGADIVAWLGLAYRSHFACTAFRIRSCSATKCMDMKNRLSPVIPDFPSWHAMKEWALQVAACFCSNKFQALGNIVSVTVDIMLRYEGTYPVGDPHVQSDQETYVDGKYIEWADPVDLVDLFRVFSWLRAITTGQYLPVSLGHHLLLADARMATIFETKVHSALAHSRDLGLCPRRVWAIASHLPEREINLLGLIPEKKDGFPGIKDPLHRFCTLDFCEQAAVDSTGVIGLHKCDGGCAPTNVFTFGALDKAATEDKPTAWRLEGNSTLDHGQKYMAVSHVWSDGTGKSMKVSSGHRVNQCLYNFFCDMAKILGCDGIWWDAICIPDEKVARSKALKNMHLNYENAEYTLVHDLYLCNIPWINAEIASFSIIMSPWFTRGWTALELARSKRVLVLFKSENGKPAFKDLKDIFSKSGEPSSPVRQLSTYVIKAVQDRLHDLNGLLTSLGPRFTSWASDLVTISQQLARTEFSNSTLSSHGQYIEVLSHLHQVYDAQLFHNAATVAGSWLPQTLMELPIVPTSGEVLHVEKNGDVVGLWGLLEATEGDLADLRLIWKSKQPLMDLQVQKGLRSLKDHLLLVELNLTVHCRALLVRLMGTQSAEVLCQFVGPIYFRPTKLYLSGSRVIRIVNGFSRT